MENEKTVDTLENDNHGLCMVMISIDDLHDFKGYPFKVLEDGAMFELAKSIEEKGVIVPLILRKNPYGEGYEIISGHRRKTACKWVGVTEIPAIIMELNDNDAIITMVDSNLQRENIKPSEKAFAYKMKLDAMKQQGKLCGCQQSHAVVDAKHLLVSVRRLACFFFKQVHKVALA